MESHRVHMEKLDNLQQIKNVYYNILTESSFFLDEAIVKEIRKRFESTSNTVYDLSKEYEGLLSGDVSQLVIGVIGSFNSGKSTFINSLLGDNLLKMDSKPSTARVSRIQYGDNFEIIKKLKNGNPVLISFEEFNKLCNHGDDRTVNEDDIDHFVINFPAEVLKGFVFVDTPGFSSTSVVDDEATKCWIPRFDLIIWLVSATKGALDNEQKKILDGMTEKLKIAVLNRIDQKPDTSIPNIKIEFEKHFDEVFCYSARCILEERLAEKPMLKGFKEFAEYAKKDLSLKKEFQFKLEGDSLIYQSGKHQPRIDNIFPSNDPKYQDFHSEFIKYLHKLRNNVLVLKRKDLESKISDTINREELIIISMLNALNSIHNRVKNKHIDIKITQNVSKNAVEENLKNKYNNYRNLLFDKVFNELFSATELQIGLIFKEKLRFFKWNDKQISQVSGKVVKLVRDSFNEFSKELFHDLERNLNDNLFNLSIYEKERELIDIMEDKLASSVGNSMKLFYYLYLPSLNQELDKEKEKLKKYIDFIVPDEEHFELIQKSLIHITNWVFEQELSEIRIKEKHIAETITKLEGVKK